MNPDNRLAADRWSAQAWINKLVAMDTTSRNSNLGLIELVRDYLRSCGLQPRLTFDREGNKANLFCSVPDVRGADRGGWVLSGHTDVVPVDGQDWNTSPFVPTLVGDRIYGRGTSDMKGFIAVALAQIPLLLQRRLAKPLHIALSYDEEVGCLGVPLLLEDLVTRGINPEGCLVGEPTSMRIVGAHKEYSVHRCVVTGQSAHSSLPMAGVNAIESAAELVHFIRELSEKLGRSGTVDQAYDFPYSSLQTSIIHGGSAANVIPAECQFDLSIRNLPEVEMHSILDEVKQYAQASILPGMLGRAPGCSITFETMVRVRGLRAEPGAPLLALLSSLLNDKTVHKVAYGSEAGLFQLAGIPAVVCGPGDILRAHRENEYIELRELDECESLLQSLVRDMTLNDLT